MSSEFGERPAIAFVGTYPPRRCGIASFSQDLAAAVTQHGARATPMVLAVTEPSGQHQYPADVKYEIRQGVKSDYARAAEFVNCSDVRVVSIQHEYGIFGGDDGTYILEFLSALRVPAVVTLHTVLKHPTELQAAIVQSMARSCAQLVVMSQVAKDLLASAYGISGSNVHIIAHGIPEMVPRDRAALKTRLGVPGRPVLLTFGLLSPNKGVETVIRALPAVVARFPELRYFVVGATHPVIVRRDGEAYRTMLEREAVKLGVRDHLLLRDQFISAEELRRYLQAADVFISPYLNEAQVTSGALSYAMGAGAAVVSTPYWHAQELLADGRGRLFPFQDHAALAHILSELLSSPGELERLRNHAVAFASKMVWPRIGDTYFELLAHTVEHEKPRRTETRPRRASSLPDLSLDHLVRMTDDTGIIQHASYSVPARRTGYCVDDNARALIVALQADRVNSSRETRRLVTTYLGYLHASQAADGHFDNFMSYSRVVAPSDASDDCLGRALWSLGATVQLAEDAGCRALAREMFHRALPNTRELGPRGTAQAILGLASFLSTEPEASNERGLLAALGAKLVRTHQEHATGDWRWFESTLTYDNALIPLALFVAYLTTGDRASLRVARESLEFLEQVCFEGDRLHLVGNAGWHSRGGPKSVADEQAIDAAALVLAFRGAYLATNDHHYLRRMRQAFAWFLGENRLGLPLYDFATGGCRDGLGVVSANQNQGAESTICFLMALLKMLELADEGLEHADPRASAVN